MDMKKYSGAAMLLASLLCTRAHPQAHAPTEESEQLIADALRLEGNRERGARLFRSECSECHGKKAQGNAQRLIPALAAQRRAYLVKQFADFAEMQRNAAQMHMVVRAATISKPRAWADLASYLNGLPIPAKSQTGDGLLLDLGEGGYKQWCAGCHAEDGRGDEDRFIPSLRNQHYRYLLREMQAIGVGHRALDPELVRFIGSLSGDELVGIADYVSRLRGPIDDHARVQEDGSLGK